MYFTLSVRFRTNVRHVFALATVDPAERLTGRFISRLPGKRIAKPLDATKSLRASAKRPAVRSFIRLAGVQSPLYILHTTPGMIISTYSPRAINPTLAPTLPPSKTDIAIQLGRKDANSNGCETIRSSISLPHSTRPHSTLPSKK